MNMYTYLLVNRVIKYEFIGDFYLEKDPNIHLFENDSLLSPKSNLHKPKKVKIGTDFHDKHLILKNGAFYFLPIAFSQIPTF